MAWSTGLGEDMQHRAFRTFNFSFLMGLIVLKGKVSQMFPFILEYQFKSLPSMLVRPSHISTSNVVFSKKNSSHKIFYTTWNLQWPLVLMFAN